MLRTLALLFSILLVPWGAAAADHGSASCDTKAAACGNDDQSFVQTHLATIRLGEQSVEAFHKMARSTKSKQEQLALVEYGENLVRKLRAQTANGTKHLDGDEEALLGEVINLIRVSMYGSMQEQHDLDQGSLNNKFDEIVRSNSDLAGKLGVGGSVHTAHNTSNGALEEHSNCRGAEAALKGIVNESLVVLDALIVEIDEPPTINRALFIRTIPALTVYFKHAQTYVDWYQSGFSSFTEAKAAFDNATASHEAKTSICDTAQTKFETAYSLWKQELVTACGDHASQHSVANATYQTLQIQFAPLVDNRKIAFEAGEVLVVKIECLLGTNDCDDSPDPNLTRWELVAPEAPAASSCSTELVQYDKCQAGFILQFYSGLPEDAPAKGCPPGP